MFRHVRALLLCLMLPAFASGPCTANPNTFQDLLDRNEIGYQVPPVGKAILVNIPAFELITFEDGRPLWRSRVIIGAPWHRTPRIQTYVTAVRFRPTWRPTPSMLASGEYRDRVWPPGENNPLGLAAVRLGPELLVYLHDTNHRELFAQENRALSHGCVRVQQWDTLVAFVLDMDLAEVRALANGWRTFDAAAPPIPVTLGYFTRFPDADGAITTHPDIYKLDRSAALTPSDVLTCADDNSAD